MCWQATRPAQAVLQFVHQQQDVAMALGQSTTSLKLSSYAVVCCCAVLV
jgi:hypothetical protein